MKTTFPGAQAAAGTELGGECRIRLGDRYGRIDLRLQKVFGVWRIDIKIVKPGAKGMRQRNGKGGLACSALAADNGYDHACAPQT